METAATFLILLTFYFLGCLAVVQLAIKPVRKLVPDPDNKTKHWETNYSKLLAISLLLSIATSTIALLLFP
ncbi:hypothetical protein J0A67_10865 [Algoriphagus aestuariicola]|jgi:hypothetical protein|uniref:Uncharacterized protein n=1 Tax=Algoriphagus aestuariicola TaxID=1852016 RepID=A0ABS3BRA7_9BACT|nr:hypothetical protein [Algoriphagus aestuariicola]MBN7801364.1 hypothetical protein [Algoriphagus aestuariicola]